MVLYYYVFSFHPLSIWVDRRMEIWQIDLLVFLFCLEAWILTKTPTVLTIRNVNAGYPLVLLLYRQLRATGFSQITIYPHREWPQYPDVAFTQFVPNPHAVELKWKASWKCETSQDQCWLLYDWQATKTVDWSLLCEHFFLREQLFQIPLL